MTGLGDWIAAQADAVAVAKEIDPLALTQTDIEGGDADRSIRALKAVAKTQSLVTLAPSACLNGSGWLERLKTSDASTAQSLRQEWEAMHASGTVKTVLALLNERALGAKSKFDGYIQQLPTKVPLPMTWTQKQRATLNLTAAWPTVDAELVRNLYDNYAAPLANKFPSLWPEAVRSLDSFLWAYTIVSSRAFTLPGSSEPTLLPVIDMANHDAESPAAKIKRDENGSYQLVALRDIEAEQSVTISYGDLSNAQLLCRYGFVLPTSTPFDSIRITSAELSKAFTALLNEAEDDSEEEDDDDAKEQDNDDDTTSTSENPPAKRRKLFASDDKDSDGLFFLLHGDADTQFGLNDTLLDFVFAKSFPSDALYDVLTRLLRRRDKAFSRSLETQSTEEQQTLVHALITHERHVCRRILLGILSLEEGSSGSDDEDEEESDQE